MRLHICEDALVAMEVENPMLLQRMRLGLAPTMNDIEQQQDGDFSPADADDDD